MNIGQNRMSIFSVGHTDAYLQAGAAPGDRLHHSHSRENSQNLSAAMYVMRWKLLQSLGLELEEIRLKRRGPSLSD